MLIDIPDQLVRALFSRPVAYYRLEGPKTNDNGASPENMGGAILPGEIPPQQNLAGRTPNHGPLLHAAIGLSGEAGELLDTVKKAWAYGQILDKENLKEELGDLMFYWIAACQEAGFHPQTVIQHNIAKLRARYPSGEFNAADAAERKDKQ